MDCFMSEVPRCQVPALTNVRMIRPGNGEKCAMSLAVHKYAFGISLDGAILFSINTGYTSHLPSRYCHRVPACGPASHQTASRIRFRLQNWFPVPRNRNSRGQSTFTVEDNKEPLPCHLPAIAEFNTVVLERYLIVRFAGREYAVGKRVRVLQRLVGEKSVVSSQALRSHLHPGELSRSGRASCG